VMGIIVPGGGGTINTSPSLGCCCTEYGGWASTGCSVYDGTIGQCIGRDFTGSECCAQYGSVGCAEGVGVRWVAGDTPCSMCDPNSGGSHQCCCDRARTRFESPQALGIGVITDGDEDDIGTWYTLDVYLAPGVGGYELSGRVQDVYCFNAAEDNMGGGGWGMCTDGRYQPGVAGSAVNPSYPASFKPQRVCPGTAVTVMGMTNAAFNGSGYGVMASRGAPPSDRTGTLGLYVGTCLGNGTVGSPNALATWFTTENAHDLTCT
jgi:hypothetical protein